MAVYVLSFWHYLVYGLAFFWRRVPLRRFKRDAILLKTVSLIPLGFVFLSASPNAYSLVVTIAGFSLNIAAARTLGSDRTYYGYEVGGFPAERVTAFPYSVMSHPMLIGNILAFSGMLLDSGFASVWWPLVLLHVLFNFQVLLMEIYGGKSRLLGTLWPLAGAAFGSVLLLAGFWEVWPFAVAAIVIGLVFGATLYSRYSAFTEQNVMKEQDHERSRS